MLLAFFLEVLVDWQKRAAIRYLSEIGIPVEEAELGAGSEKALIAITAKLDDLKAEIAALKAELVGRTRDDI